MKKYYYNGRITKYDSWLGLKRTIKEEVPKILILMAGVCTFIYLMVRAEGISRDNYCSKYPKAEYCKIYE